MNTKFVNRAARKSLSMFSDVDVIFGIVSIKLIDEPFTNVSFFCSTRVGYSLFCSSVGDQILLGIVSWVGVAEQDECRTETFDAKC